MKILLSFLLSIFMLTSFGQTTPLSFTNTPLTDPDFSRPGAGGEKWIGQWVVTAIPGPIDDYARYHWGVDFQPGSSSATTFSWTAMDADFQSAITNNHKLSIGVMQTCGACGTDSKPIIAGGGMVYPQFLHTLMQGEAHKDYIYGGEWIPNYNSTNYLTAWKRLQDSIEYHINNTSFRGVPYSKVIRWIDVNGYGDYGEWANNQPDIGSGWSATVSTLDSIIAYVVRGHPNTHCQLLNSVFDAKQLSSNVNIPADVGWFALTITNNTGKQGYRRESWGIPNSLAWWLYAWTNGNTTVFNGLNFGTEISARYKFAPITGEMQDACQTSHMSDLSNEITSYHVVSFGNGNLDGGCELGNATAYTNITAASKTAGYRIVLNSGGSTTTSPVAGGSFNIVMHWRNVGTTPSYDHWKVRYRLMQGTTIKFTGVSTFDPYLYLPNTSDSIVTDNFTLTNVAAGTGYTLTIGVEDANGYQRDMPLFITTAQNADGSYNLRTNITVGNGTPIANAGSNQTITLPTSSVTLDGTGSSSASTFSWTQVSGPNTATLATPAAVTTTASGLIAGVYVFQLAVNGGSTSQTTVTVNPIQLTAANIFTSQIPATGTSNDYPGQTSIQGVEDGVRFKSTIAGYITGIRFYKTTTPVINSGIHIGELYTNTGTRLAQATFTNETTSGWQMVSISPAVAITANTTYVAAYWSSLGNYVEDNNYFLNKSVVNNQLTAPADGLNGASANPDLTYSTNGTWIYTATPAFPNNAYLSANYWVDIVFSQNTPGTTQHPKAAHLFFIKRGP